MLAKLADDPHIQAIASAAAATARHYKNPFEAEIVPNCQPHWHLITVRPAQERIACAHLVGRRFGIYLPEFDHTEIVRGRMRHRSENLFPGYVFLFVWDIMAHWRRLRACPGVHRIMLDGDWPVIVPDRVIKEIQDQEFDMLMEGPKSPLKQIPKKRGKRGYRREAAPTSNGAETAEVFVSMSTRSFWGELAALDGDGRNRLLHQALGLAP